MTKFDFVKIKNMCSLKNTGRKYLQITYLIKNSYPKFLKKNTRNLMIRKQTMPFKTGKMFEQRNYMLAKNHMKRCSMSFITREMMFVS